MCRRGGTRRAAVLSSFRQRGTNLGSTGANPVRQTRACSRGVAPPPHCCGRAHFHAATPSTVRATPPLPRLEEGDYSGLVRELKKVLAKDANIVCAATAAEASAALGAALRGSFGSSARVRPRPSAGPWRLARGRGAGDGRGRGSAPEHCRHSLSPAPKVTEPPFSTSATNFQQQSLCPALLERLKEKNVQMSRAAEEALRALGTHCYTVAEVGEDLQAALQHKNPKGQPRWLGCWKEKGGGSCDAMARGSTGHEQPPAWLHGVGTLLPSPRPLSKNGGEH